jgi:hypothetical protein
MANRSLPTITFIAIELGIVLAMVAILMRGL